MHTEIGSHPVPIVMSVQKADTFFSHILHCRLASRAPTLARALSLSAGNATDARARVQKLYSRGGQNAHGSHLDKEREKTASRYTRELQRWQFHSFVRSLDDLVAVKITQASC